MAIKSPEDADPDIFAKIRMRQRILILLISQLISLIASSQQIYMALQQDDLRIIATKAAEGTIIARIGKNLATTTTKLNLDVGPVPTNLRSDLKLHDSDKVLNKVFGCSLLGVEGMLKNPNILLSEEFNLNSVCCNKSMRSKLTHKLEHATAMAIGNRRAKGQSQSHQKEEHDRGQGQGQSQVKTQRETKSVGKEKPLPSSITVFALSATAIVITLTNYFSFINYRNPYLRKVMLNLICFLGFIIQVINCTTFYIGIQIQVENSPHDLQYCDQNNLNQNIRIVPNTVTDIDDLKVTNSDALNSNGNGNGAGVDIKIDDKGSQKLFTLCLLHLQQQLHLKRSHDLNHEAIGNIFKVKVSPDFDSDTDASASCPSFALLYILWSLMILTTVLIPLTIIYSCKWRDRTFFRLIDDISFGRKGTLFSRQRSMIQQVKFDLETELDFDKRTLDQLQECLLEEYEMLKVLENNLKYKYMLINNNSNNNELLPTDANAHTDSSNNPGQGQGQGGVENATSRNIDVNNRTHADTNTNTNTTTSTSDTDSEAKLSGQSQSSLATSTNSTTLATEYDAYVTKLRDYNLQLSAFMNKAEAFQEIRKLDLQILEEYAHYVNFTKIDRLHANSQNMESKHQTGK